LTQRKVQLFWTPKCSPPYPDFPSLLPCLSFHTCPCFYRRKVPLPPPTSPRSSFMNPECLLADREGPMREMRSNFAGSPTPIVLLHRLVPTSSTASAAVTLFVGHLNTYVALVWKPQSLETLRSPFALPPSFNWIPVFLVISRPTPRGHFCLINHAPPPIDSISRLLGSLSSCPGPSGRSFFPILCPYLIVRLWTPHPKNGPVRSRKSFLL